jgi:DNA repair protein RecO (recombination protein O)
MATYLTDDAICLRVTDFSETSQIVGLFTRKHGLVPLIAKGAKRSSKKNVMSGPLDLLTSGEVVFVPAKEPAGYGQASASGRGGAQLGTLAAWELADHRNDLRRHLPALNAGMVCAEVTAHLLLPHDPHEELFTDLEAAMDLLPRPAQRARAAVAYVKAALTAAGYWPQFGACLACGNAPARANADGGESGAVGQIRFSGRAGGVLCASCRVEEGGVITWIPALLAVALDRLPLPAGLRSNPPERPADVGALASAMTLLLAQVEMITDKPLRTRFLVRSIFTDASTALPSPRASL